METRRAGGLREPLCEPVAKQSLRAKGARRTTLLSVSLNLAMASRIPCQLGVYTVEHHVRGKWVCSRCETLVQVPVPPHVID